MIGRTFQPDILAQVQEKQTFNLVPHPLARHFPKSKLCGTYKCSSQHYVAPEQVGIPPVVYPAWKVFARDLPSIAAIYTVGNVLLILGT
jgi:hypothetical protein